jgi:hypothetical protein
MALVKTEKMIRVRLRGGYSCKVGQVEHHGGEFGKVIQIPESELKERANLYEGINAPTAKKKEPEKKPEPKKEPKEKDDQEEKTMQKPIKDRMIREKDTTKK